MPRALALCVALLLALTLTPGAFAQGDISEPPVLFQRTLTPFDDTPSADLEGVSATPSQDHLFETGWWFRVEGDSQETVFPVPDTQSYVGSSSSLTWNDVGARGKPGLELTQSVAAAPCPKSRDVRPIGNASGHGHESGMTVLFAGRQMQPTPISVTTSGPDSNRIGVTVAAEGSPSSAQIT